MNIPAHAINFITENKCSIEWSDYIVSVNNRGFKTICYHKAPVSQSSDPAKRHHVFDNTYEALMYALMLAETKEDNFCYEEIENDRIINLPTKATG